MLGIGRLLKWAWSYKTLVVVIAKQVKVWQYLSDLYRYGGWASEGRRSAYMVAAA